MIFNPILEGKIAAVVQSIFSGNQSSHLYHFRIQT
ncbi:unnamed protein product [Brassica rapa]|uniref:Uncharacterized protein n=1 Tax=Brassica campestris TaxID=3711 RepID=A0A3P5YET2_BRACM|nr:unnamed protein product [Brassica rapa]VDC58398.1 unnamed protein product [Brassica rapa]